MADLAAVKEAFQNYQTELDRIKRISGNEYRRELKHMHFWLPYHHDVVAAIAKGEKPQVDKRKLQDINGASQREYEPISSSELEAVNQEVFLGLCELVKTLSDDTKVPYRKNVSYPPSEFLRVLEEHLHMHTRYLHKIM